MNDLQIHISFIFPDSLEEMMHNTNSDQQTNLSRAHTDETESVIPGEQTDEKNVNNKIIRIPSEVLYRADDTNNELTDKLYLSSDSECNTLQTLDYNGIYKACHNVNPNIAKIKPDDVITLPSQDLHDDKDIHQYASNSVSKTSLSVNFLTSRDLDHNISRPGVTPVLYCPNSTMNHSRDDNDKQTSDPDITDAAAGIAIKNKACSIRDGYEDSAHDIQSNPFDNSNSGAIPYISIQRSNTLNNLVNNAVDCDLISGASNQCTIETFIYHGKPIPTNDPYYDCFSDSSDDFEVNHTDIDRKCGNNVADNICQGEQTISSIDQNQMYRDTWKVVMTELKIKSTLNDLGISSYSSISRTDCEEMSVKNRYPENSAKKVNGDIFHNNDDQQDVDETCLSQPTGDVVKDSDNQEFQITSTKDDVMNSTFQMIDDMKQEVIDSNTHEMSTSEITEEEIRSNKINSNTKEMDTQDDDIIETIKSGHDMTCHLLSYRQMVMRHSFVVFSGNIHE